MVSGWLGVDWGNVWDNVLEWIGGLDWGNVPAWIGTIVTSVSVTVAALTYRRSVLDKERAQASSVAAWWARRTGGDRRLDSVLLVSNGSDASVYEVAVQVWSFPAPFWLDQVPAKATSTVELTFADAYKELQGVVYSLGGLFMHMGLFSASEAPPELEFRDAVGRLWKRDKRGRLKPLQQRTIPFPKRGRGGASATSVTSDHGERWPPDLGGDSPTDPSQSPPPP
jgi:hypothetical protein